MSAGKPAVLFVCLGNICRSPLAEAAFRVEAERAGLDVEVDSAGTGGWHAGEPPDPRALAVARRNGVDMSGYRARQVEPADFARFSHIVALDGDNLAVLRRLRPKKGRRIVASPRSCARAQGRGGRRPLLRRRYGVRRHLGRRDPGRPSPRACAQGMTPLAEP